MLTKLFSWIKSNKLVIVLFLVVVYQLNRNTFGVLPLSLNTRSFDSYSGIAQAPGMGKIANLSMPYQPELAPVQSADRLVITDTNLSLLVKNVKEVIDKILVDTTTLEGFMVNTNLSNPDNNATGNLTLRVPTKNLKTLLEKIRSYGHKVTSEQVNGTDVTDQYVDNEARLAPLLQSKSKLEALLSQAQRVPEILEVQRELTNVQIQIDNLKGQQDYLKKSSELSRVTVYLSTDEFSLPYAPETSWRPEVIFKQAVRSVVTNLRWAGEWAIWLAVYSPAILLVIFLYKKFTSPRF